MSRDITESGWRDLNPRPLDPQSSALPNCATAREPSHFSSGRLGAGRSTSASFGRSVIEGHDTTPERAKRRRLVPASDDPLDHLDQPPAQVDGGEHDHQLEVPRRPVLAVPRPPPAASAICRPHVGHLPVGGIEFGVQNLAQSSQNGMAAQTGGTPWRRSLKDRSLSRAARQPADDLVDADPGSRPPRRSTSSDASRNRSTSSS